MSASLETRHYFDVQLKRDQLVLTAGKYIGVIPISSRVALNIHPKLPVGKLVRVLAIARESPILIPRLERIYEADGELDVFDMLVSAFRRELRIVEQHGLLREYRRATEVGQAIRGRLLLQDTLLKHWPVGGFDRAAYEYFEFSVDNPLNKAIEYTIWHILRVYPVTSHRPDRDVIRDLRNTHQYFSLLSPDRQRTFLPALRDHLRVRVPTEPHASFYPLLSVCRMILDDLGVELDDRTSEAIRLPPMVIDMETVYQRFLLNVLRQAADESGRYKIWDTAREQQKPLFSESRIPAPEGMSRAPSVEPAKPDFTVAENDVPVVVGDAKYKGRHDVDDVYQVIAHAQAYRVHDALLVYPGEDSQESVTFGCLGQVGDIRVFICSFPMGVDDLDSAARELLTGIAQIADTRVLSAPTISNRANTQPFSPEAS